MNSQRLKRVFDVTASLMTLLLLSPILIVIALLIRLDSRGPAIFMQERLGKDGTVFTLYKFRTMIDSAPDGAVTDPVLDPRVTRVGSILRAWSLDELPQLVNILRGEMSLVGPRPDRVFRLPTYTPLQKKRLQVRPGITGLAQINGRNRLTWKKRYDYDVEYVERWSLWLDVVILCRTVQVVLAREGIDYTEDVSTEREGTSV